MENRNEIFISFRYNGREIVGVENKDKLFRKKLGNI